MWQMFIISRESILYHGVDVKVWALEVTVNVDPLALGGHGHSLRGNVKSAGTGGSDSTWLRPRGPLGRVPGSQAHPGMAKLGSQQIFTEYALCARHRDTVVYFRDKNSCLDGPYILGVGGRDQQQEDRIHVHSNE